MARLHATPGGVTSRSSPSSLSSPRGGTREGRGFEDSHVVGFPKKPIVVVRKFWDTDARPADSRTGGSGRWPETTRGSLPVSRQQLRALGGLYDKESSEDSETSEEDMDEGAEWTPPPLDHRGGLSKAGRKPPDEWSR